MHSRPFSPYLLLALFLTSQCVLPSFAESTQEIQSLDSVAASVQHFLLGLQEGGAGQASVVVDTLDSRLRLSACTAPLEVSLAPGSRSSGRTLVAVHCTAPHAWSLYVPAKVSVPVFVVIAAHPLFRDQVIRAADISVEKRDGGDISGSYVSDPNQMIGKIATRVLSAGMILTPDAVQSVRLIHRGDRVSLVAEGSGLSVRSVGIALADAGVGEHVSVRNESSQRVVEGTVNQDGAVVIHW